MYLPSFRAPAFPNPYSQRQLPAAAVARQNQEVRFSSGCTYTEEEYKQMAQATSTRQTGNSPSDRIHFALVTSAPLNSSDSYKIQILKGLHPAGYDSFGFSSTRQQDGKYMNRWSCSASCD